MVKDLIAMCQKETMEQSERRAKLCWEVSEAVQRGQVLVQFSNEKI